MKTFTLNVLPLVRDYNGGVATFKEDVNTIVSKIRAVEEQFSHFKIGKTGNTIAERSAEPDYSDKYDGIVSLYESSSKKLASAMEAALINSFIDDPKCDNDKAGTASVNDQMADSDRYVVYLVFKKR